MTPHCKAYMKHFGYGIDDTILCEVCGEKAVDLHHIDGRGKGKDIATNIIAVCRKCHNAAHGIGNTYLHKDVIQQIHNEYLKRCN